MPEQTHPIVQLLQEDRRYKLDAYQFVRDGLAYAQEVLHLGERKATSEETSGEGPKVEQHLTGQQLCEAIRQYAISQYGLMAKTVLNSWGLRKKSKTDRREDFDNCDEFDQAFVNGFQIDKTKS